MALARSKAGAILQALCRWLLRLCGSTALVLSLPLAAVDALPAALTALPGDAARGSSLVRSREGGHCILCHSVPELPAREAGNIGPPLAGVGTRLSAAQLRLRVVDNAALNPATVMPSYHRTTGLQRVGAAYSGKPVLTAQEVEDVVAYLLSLK